MPARVKTVTRREESSAEPLIKITFGPGVITATSHNRANDSAEVILSSFSRQAE